MVTSTSPRVENGNRTRTRTWTLGVVAGRGGLADVEAAGQMKRLVHEMSVYRKVFTQQVYYWSRGASGDAGPGIAVSGRFADLGRCDLLRVMNLRDITTAMAAKSRWGIPWVLHFGYDPVDVARALHKPARALASRLYRRMADGNADLVIATTERLAGLWKRSRVAVVPNGVDLRRFPGGDPGSFRPSQPTPPYWRDRTDGPVVYVGRLAPEKRVSDLAEAMVRIGSHRRLVVVGEGPERRRLERVVPWAQFSGRLDPDAIAPILAGAVCFVLPSVTEGCPKAPLEAMAMDVPVIMRRGILPAAPAIRYDGSVQQLTEAIESVFKAPSWAERVGLRGREHVRLYHDLAVTLPQEVKVCASVLR